MPSPFPGMNPYLEQDDAWHDFHERFLPTTAEFITPQVRPGYIVKIDEHVYIHELPDEQRRLVGRADGAVISPTSTAPTRPAGAVLEAPVHALLFPTVDIERQSFLEVRDRHSREVITIVELLSPSNKAAGSDREQYLAKRRQFVTSRVHLVEIDLLRGGPRLPLQNMPECDYYALISRAEERPRVGVWPVRLRDRLPEIPIPLRAGEPEAKLDVQAVLNRVYDAAAYEDYIYQGAPQPALRPDDAEWARQFLPTTS